MQNEIPMEAWEGVMTLLIDIANKKGISTHEIAHKLNSDIDTIEDVFNLNHPPDIQLFLEISGVLRLTISIEDTDVDDVAKDSFESSMKFIGRRPSDDVN